MSELSDSSHAGPVRIENFTDTTDFLSRRVQVSSRCFTHRKGHIFKYEFLKTRADEIYDPCLRVNRSTHTTLLIGISTYGKLVNLRCLPSS